MNGNRIIIAFVVAVATVSTMVIGTGFWVINAIAEVDKNVAVLDQKVTDHMIEHP